MDVYLDLVVLLNFLIDTLLLLAADRLCGFPPTPGRAALGGLLGGLYAGACLLPGFAFLGNLLWRTVSLLLMGGIAFGMNKSAIRRALVFVILSMALGGLGMAMAKPGFLGLLASAGALALLCLLGFRERLGQAKYLPVELHYGGHHVKLTALQDTGNTLHDPVTGAAVLVISGEVAQKMTGLTKDQLCNPVEAMGTLPGLRLIPYRAVGQPGGLLLAMRFPQVRIGSWQGSRLVAFAPEGIGTDGSYQALTGGTL